MTADATPRRIPEHLPYQVVLDPVRHLIRHSLAEFVLSVVMGAFLVAGGFFFLLRHPEPTYQSTQYGDVPTPVVVWVSFAMGAFLLIGAPIIILSRGRGRAVLGADREGLYLRPDLNPKRVLYLPWDRIAWIAVRHHYGPQLCVKPVRPGVEALFAERGGSLGARIRQARRLKKLGTGIAVPIGGAARDIDDVVAALRGWSAGATRIDVG